MTTWSTFWRSILSSWHHHSGVQFATFSVLTATFTVIISFSVAALNLSRILQSWGESVQMTAYLADGLQEDQVSKVESALKGMREFASVRFISKDEAKSKFSKQMESYAPDLLKDTGFSNPFPASFEMAFGSRDYINDLKSLAGRIEQIAGIEDVSYGQDWVNNYASVVSGFRNTSFAIAAILLLGSILVIGNSIRTTVSHRREEIEVLRLVGATESMVRAPFVAEGAVMGTLAAAVSLVIGFVFYQSGVHLISESMSFLNLGSQVQFLSLPMSFSTLACGALIGASGSYFCVRRITFGEFEDA